MSPETAAASKQRALTLLQNETVRQLIHWTPTEFDNTENRQQDRRENWYQTPWRRTPQSV